MADELDPVTGLPKVPAGDPSNPEGTPKEPEPQVPLSRLREVSDKVKNLEEELAKFKSASPTPQISEEEKKLRETLEKVKLEEKEQGEQEEKQLRTELDELHTVHGEFDEKRLLEIVEEYGVYDENNNVKWDKAIELLDRLTQNPEYKPKINLPNGQRAATPPASVAPPVEVKGKSLFELAQEGLKKFNIIK